MVNIVKQTGMEKEQTFLAPLALTPDKLKEQFPRAKQGAAFSYGVTFLDPTRETLEKILEILARAGLPFGGADHAEILDRFRRGEILIDNLGVVNTAQRLADGRALYWYFVKSPKDEEGVEFTLRSAYPNPDEEIDLRNETRALTRRDSALYGLLRKFSRLIIDDEEGGKGCTVDLRDDTCGSVWPDFGLNVRLKTIEVEVDPTAEPESVAGLVGNVREKILALGAHQTSIRMPHLARGREAIAPLRQLLEERGAKEEDYLHIYSPLRP